MVNFFFAKLEDFNWRALCLDGRIAGEQGKIAHAYDLSICKAAAQPGVHSEFQGSLSYTKRDPIFKKIDSNNKYPIQKMPKLFLF